MIKRMLCEVQTPFSFVATCHSSEDVKIYQKVFFYKYFFLFSPSLHIIHSVLNTSVKVSGSGHHYLPRKMSLKLC